MSYNAKIWLHTEFSEPLNCPNYISVIPTRDMVLKRKGLRTEFSINSTLTHMSCFGQHPMVPHEIMQLTQTADY